jgi:hypothetical protein
MVSGGRKADSNGLIHFFFVVIVARCASDTSSQIIRRRAHDGGRGMLSPLLPGADAGSAAKLPKAEQRSAWCREETSSSPDKSESLTDDSGLTLADPEEFLGEAHAGAAVDSHSPCDETASNTSWVTDDLTVAGSDASNGRTPCRSLHFGAARSPDVLCSEQGDDVASLVEREVPSSPTSLEPATAGDKWKHRQAMLALVPLHT